MGCPKESGTGKERHEHRSVRRRVSTALEFVLKTGGVSEHRQKGRQIGSSESTSGAKRLSAKDGGVRHLSFPATFPGSPPPVVCRD
jgi:hypothetical protein